LEALVLPPPKIIISSQEFQDSWVWFLDHISTEQTLVEEHGYFLDHKHWHYPDSIKCVDKCDDADVNLAKLYLISQLASVSDYLSDLKKNIFTFNLSYSSSHLDEDIARVIKAQETENHLNAFRNSLSEHLAYWVILASIIKVSGYQDFSIAKPNLQPEDKGPDGLACVLSDDYNVIKIVSIKNSIISPQDLISSSSFRNNSDIDLNEKKILDEFHAFQTRNRGFQRLDDKLNTLLQELHQDPNKQIRWILLSQQSQFNASIIADEQYATRDLFTGFKRISDQPIRCIGIYVGSENWKDLATNVQIKVKEILTATGISY
jgi:hypothetical protein